MAEQDWVARMQGLTVQPQDCEDDPLAAARARVGRLTEAARDFVADARPGRHLPGVEPLTVSAPGWGAVTALAAELCGTHGPVAGHCDASCTDTQEYLDALQAAATAVYYCRRIQHPAGRCWFSPLGPEADVCGHVLAAAHAIGVPPHRPAN